MCSGLEGEGGVADLDVRDPDHVLFSLSPYAVRDIPCDEVFKIPPVVPSPQPSLKCSFFFMKDNSFYVQLAHPKVDLKLRC